MNRPDPSLTERVPRRDLNLWVTVASVAALGVMTIILVVRAWLAPEPVSVRVRWEVDGTPAGWCVVNAEVADCTRTVTVPDGTEAVPYQEEP